jgi:hypothetical protein
VEHGPERNRGMFLLHHGVQRKLGITITHESSTHLRWIEVCEVVIGRVRGREEGQAGMGDSPLTLPVMDQNIYNKQLIINITMIDNDFNNNLL